MFVFDPRGEARSGKEGAILQPSGREGRACGGHRKGEENMSNVNYVREHMQFMEYAADEKLTSGERMLWYALMHIFNQRARGNDWPDEFIRVNNARLAMYCSMKYDTLAKARAGLVRRGLIDYVEGLRNQRSPAYRMRYFCREGGLPRADAGERRGTGQIDAEESRRTGLVASPERASIPAEEPVSDERHSVAPDEAKGDVRGKAPAESRGDYPAYLWDDEPGDDADFDGCRGVDLDGMKDHVRPGDPSCAPGNPPIPTRNCTRSIPKKPDYSGSGAGSSQGHIYINRNLYDTDKPSDRLNQRVSREEDEKTVTTAAGVRGMLARSWENAFGKKPVPAALECLLYWGEICQLEPEVMCEAVRKSALRCADSPVEYIVALFKDWKRHHVRTLEQMEDYLEDY